MDRFLTVLPADTLATVILAVALIAILRDALIAELSLGAVAIAGKLALAFTAAYAAILASILNRGTPVARSLPIGRITRVAALVILVPIHAALAIVMVVVCHVERAPFLE